MRFKFAILLCAIGVLSLSGCGKTEVANTSPSTEKSAAVEQHATPTQSQAQANEVEYPQLLSVVAKTRTAVDTGDFQKAQQEFDQFEGVWSQVEDGIKEKSPGGYDAIEGDMDHITAALRSSESAQALSALQALDLHIQSIPHS